MGTRDPCPHYPQCPGLGVSVGDRASWIPRPTAFNQDSVAGPVVRGGPHKGLEVRSYPMEQETKADKGGYLGLRVKPFFLFPDNF